MTTFSSSILVITLKYLKANSKIILVLTVLVIISAFNYFEPSEYLGRGDDYYLKRYVPYPKVNEEYLLQNEEYLRLPNAASVRPNSLPEKINCINCQVTQIQNSNVLDVTFKVTAVDNAYVTYGKYNFPGWKAKIDGKTAKIESGSLYGDIRVDVTGGEHLVEIYFGETSRNLFLDGVSLATILLLIGFIVKNSLGFVKIK